MIFMVAALSSLMFFVFLVGVFQIKKGPEAQLRKRLDEMIDAAEAERAKSPKRKKNPKPPVIQMTQTNAPAPRNPRSFFVRVIQPIIKKLDEKTQQFAPGAIRALLEDKIFRAGKVGVWSVQRLITFWCLSIAVCTLLAILLVKDLMIHPVQQLFIVGLGVFAGAAVPFVVLNSKIRQRQKALRKQLPEFLDLLCVSVQAGPLIDEFSRAQNDVALGMTHQYALTQLAKRCDLEEIYLFTTSVIQAEKLGTSMTRTLKLQADNMRDRHRQYVKGEALKAPVKIIFPMVLFIFPSVFVVLLFPAMLQLIRNMGG